jgi:hypothetical protein
MGLPNSQQDGSCEPRLRLGGAVADQDRCTAGRCSEDEGRIFNRDSNATVTRWLVGNDREGVNRLGGEDPNASACGSRKVESTTVAGDLPTHATVTPAAVMAEVCREHAWFGGRRPAR